MTVIIVRKRYVVVDDRNRIFCGLARHYNFKPMDDIGDTAIKTYLSEKKAKSSFLNSWCDSEEDDFETGKYRVVEVLESIKELKEGLANDKRRKDYRSI